jgi:hypothetical protein
MSKIEVDQIDPQSGTTLTLGTSGDTVVVPSGVQLAPGGGLTLTGNFVVDGGTVKLDGNYPTGTDTLSRQSVISSSNSDALVNFGAGGKTVFCTLPAKKTISPVMDATPYVVTHASTLSLNQTIDSGVLAGPVTVTGTQTITGTVVVV